MAKKLDYSIPAGETTEINRTILYGDSMTGKTTSLKTLPKLFLPAVLFDIDEKSDILRKQFSEGEFIAYQFDRYDDKKKTRPPILYDQAKEVLLEVGNDPEVQTIIIDSMTMLYNAIIEFVRFKGNKDDTAPNTQPEWGIALNLTIKYIVNLIASQKHVILICHETSLSNDLYKIDKGVPAFAGQLGNIIPRFFKDIIHARAKREQGKTVYYWETQPTAVFVAGTTRQVDPDIQPDWSILWNAERKQI